MINAEPVGCPTPGACSCVDLTYKIFEITLEEARALNFLLRLHEGLLRQSPDEHLQILRLINGLGDWINKYDRAGTNKEI